MGEMYTVKQGDFLSKIAAKFGFANAMTIWDDPQNAKLTKAQRIVRAKALLKAGTKHLLAGRTQKAKDALMECVDLDPAAAECHRNLGTLYRRVRATHKAREHFARYLELAPGAPDADRIKRMLEQ